MTLEVIYSVRLHPGLISLAYAADKYCAGLEQANPDMLLTAKRTLELREQGVFSVCYAES